MISSPAYPPVLLDCRLPLTDVLSVTPSDFSRMDNGHYYGLEVTNGKDTTRDYKGGKQRETWPSVEVEATINRSVQQANLKAFTTRPEYCNCGLAIHNQYGSDGRYWRLRASIMVENAFSSCLRQSAATTIASR